MYMNGTFLPSSLRRSDSLYGLGAWNITRAKQEADKYKSNPVPVSAPVSAPAPRVIRVRPVSRREPVVVRFPTRPQNRRQELGWFQAVANIIGAAGQVYAAKEGTKAIEKQKQAQAEMAASQRELLLLESQLTERKQMLSQQGASQKNLLVAGGIAAAAGTVIYIASRKRRK